jgi:hypothetical protein
MDVLGWIVIIILAVNFLFFTPMIIRHLWEERHENSRSSSKDH